jgi:hypothetical protein
MGWVWAVVPLAALAAGCGAGQDTQGTEDTQVATPELVGSVQLSATHDVKFWDYGNGLARIEENLHADRDRGATLSLKQIDLKGRGLSDIYEIFAGANADPAVVEKLHALDLRVAAARSNVAPELPSNLVVNGEATDSDPTGPLAATSSRTASAPDELGVRQLALACGEPAGFNWDADGQWFVSNYCFQSATQPIHMCQWSATSLAFGWSPPVSYYRSSGFNQSFCSTASYSVKERVVFIGVASQFTLLNGTLPVRWVRDDAWTASGDTHFATSIASSTGSNRVGLATRMTQTGP